MKKIVLLVSLFSSPLFAATATVSVPIKGTITSTTCTFAADTVIDFGSITALNISNGTVPEKDLSMTANCDWTATGLKLTFIPTSIVTGDNQTMESGLTGVGFKLPSMGTINNLAFNTEHIWSSGGIVGGGTKAISVKIKPVKIPNQHITAGKINTNLIVRLTYD
ncbi:fimbrial protein [Salmonella enterica]|uniref:Fimbrial protein n=1 Tax=Salmonella enterica TaxID=28901 RepID=A0A5Z3B3R0_SALER|nr:fimbrial protein [Salmonella enterica]ECK3539586.1 fimbrial protein [Salmonella enterica]ECL6067868.1 fimbrial protein [Salmonella enterica]ECL6624648.1 fimbrial protein [Salmonella enterica]ECO7491282.1 fimbrial protein [Salmonella enterica]